MSLAPLLNAPLVIQLHAFAAVGALALGLVQFSLPKGTLPHRTMGWIWVGLMATVAVSSSGYTAVKSSWVLRGARSICYRSSV